MQHIVFILRLPPLLFTRMSLLLVKRRIQPMVIALTLNICSNRSSDYRIGFFKDLLRYNAECFFRLLTDTNEYGPEDSTPPTPNYTTVSPNDEDEGLYLLWTHQLLRERGFRPTSCRNSTLHEDDDLESDDSSLTNRSIEIKTTHSHRASTPHLVVEEPPQRSTLYTFFSTVFPCL
ncbi:hypothetical protein BDF14DRAFT_1993334 [Spinellus fusiger]|nr:hypothetical protein BDF14DRAFT_1993334 [Spinellus fusiger]